MTEPIFSLRNIQQRYGNRTVLDVAELDVQVGEILALVGPSGAGKSTLLRLLGFLERPSAGVLSYLGRDVSADKWPDLDARREITMVFQRPQLLRKSVAENVRYGLNVRGSKNGQHDAILEKIVGQLGLTDLLAAKAQTLSGGEMQRVALARALAIRPKILLLDEPTSNLDPTNIKLIENIVRSTNQADNTTMVLVTHNIFQAKRLAHRTGLLIDGKIVELSNTDQFFNNPQKPETAAFLNGDLIY